MMKILRKIIMACILVILAAGCTGHYPDMTGTVVDAETGNPIEGAVVLVEWTKRVGLGDYHTESVKVIEVITDHAGSFRIEGLTKPFIDPPDMTIYKKGYVAWNNKAIYQDIKGRMDFKWRKDLMIKMSKFKTEYSYNDHVEFIRMCIGSSRNIEAKKKIYNAFIWEDHFALQERIKKGPRP